MRESITSAINDTTFSSRIPMDHGTKTPGSVEELQILPLEFDLEDELIGRCPSKARLF